MTDTDPAAPQEPDGPATEPEPQSDPHGQPTRDSVATAPALQPRDSAEMPS